MKKKLITLILCGVIGGTSIAGLSIIKISNGIENPHALVNTPDITKKNATDSKDEEKLNSSKSVISEEPSERKDEKNILNNETGSESNEGIRENQKTANDGQASIGNEKQLEEGNSIKEEENTLGSDWNNKVESDEKDNSNSENLNHGNMGGGSSNGVTEIPREEVADGSFYGEVEQLIFNRVNEERVKAGVPVLSYNSTMETYARIKSKDMGVRNYFDHVNPEGEMITAQMSRDGVSYNAWGENIAYISGISDANALANQFMTNWMNSSGHRANILSTNFTSIGIGVYKAGDRFYATQEFYK